MERLNKRTVKPTEMYVVVSAEQWRRRFFWESVFGTSQSVFGRWIIFQALRDRSQ